VKSRRQIDRDEPLLLPVIRIIADKVARRGTRQNAELGGFADQIAIGQI